MIRKQVAAGTLAAAVAASGGALALLPGTAQAGVAPHRIIARAAGQPARRPRAIDAADLERLAAALPAGIERKYR